MCLGPSSSRGSVTAPHRCAHAPHSAVEKPRPAAEVLPREPDCQEAAQRPNARPDGNL